MNKDNGTYFKESYIKLKSQSPRFPNDDSSPNLQSCIDLPNFVRAEMLAKKHGLSEDVIVSLQELAILQYCRDYHNFEGLKNLITEFKIDSNRINQIIPLVFQENEYPCFSFSNNTSKAALYESGWVSGFELIKKQIKSSGNIPITRKASIIQRIFRWLSNYFQHGKD